MRRHPHDVVLCGGSAGGIQAVAALIGALPAEFPAALFVVLHRAADPQSSETLARMIASRGQLPAQSARDEQPIRPGHVHIAPPDRHMVIGNGVIRLESGPKEQRFRPCIDVTFKSAAATYGRRVVGVLLTGGFGDDGAAGLWQIKRCGGVTIVQDPADAAFPGMPQGALNNVDVDYVLPLGRIAHALIELTSGASPEAAQSPPRILIVEDESVVATNLQQSLTELGYHVVDWVPTGEAAIELAAREDPDVVLMDIHLAGALNGIESARRIWQQLQIPIVYCTAHADLATLRAVQTTESYGYVMKPFQTAAVRAAIELALARREKELR